MTTLRDRVAGRISIDITTTGHPTLFSLEEEALLVEHIKSMAEIGYGYTRAEVVQLASDYAHDTGKKGEESHISQGWYYHFLKRWPELHAVKPSSLSELRAKAASTECVSNYFTELDKILTKYNLKDKPQYIYNVDEKGINTGGGKPPNIIASRDKKAQVVASERVQTVTVLGCGSASGSLVPPYLVFPGKRMLPELLEGATPGCDGTVSQTGTGYSNTEIFTHYIKNHFLRYVPGRDSDQPILLLYDGHKSHISISLIQWARENNIVLFVLPPHTSHILQPMDVGCFGPFENLYQQEAHKFMRQSGGRSITRYDVCGLACKVYEQALSPSNLRSAFKKTGIFPFCPTVVGEDLTAPSLPYIGKLLSEAETVNMKPPSDHHMNSECNPVKTTEACAKFLEKRGGSVLMQVKIAKMPRRSINKVVGGQAMTEDIVFSKVQDYVSDTSSKGKQDKNNLKNKYCKKAQSIAKSAGKKYTSTCNGKTASVAEPVASTSGTGLSKFSKPDQSVINSESDCDSTDESEKCCVCNKWEPAVLKLKPYVTFVQWGECDDCGHWCHLSFCVPERVIRRGDKFKCPHCRG